MHYVHQEGQTVFKHAVVNMAEVSAEIMEKISFSSDDVTWLLPHQANKRILRSNCKSYGVKPDKNVDEH